jgi:hypothetical protein
LTLRNTNALSQTTILYDGIGAAGIGPVDFTQGGAQDPFNLFIVSGDCSTNVTLTVKSASGTSTLIPPTPGLATNVPFIFEYSAFTGAADFTLADSVQIGIVTTNTQAYLQLDFFGTTDTTIPEPGVLAILGLASWVSVSRGDAADEPHNDLLTEKRRPSGRSFSFWGLAFSVLPEVSFPHDQ